jgi:large subunit ribosomal protein L21
MLVGSASVIPEVLEVVMYAVIKAGGKQQRVKTGDVIEVELVHRQEHEDEITFTPLLVVDDDGKTHVGKELARAAVKGRLVGEQKGEKHKIFKYRPKTGYAKRQGHRQMYTLVEIQDISLGRRAATKKAESETEPEAEPAPAEPATVGTEAPDEAATGAGEGPAEAEADGEAEADAEAEASEESSPQPEAEVEGAEAAEAAAETSDEAPEEA